MPVCYHSVFTGWMTFLLLNQQIKALKATFPENVMQIRLEVFVQSC